METAHHLSVQPETRISHHAMLVLGGATLATQELTPTPNWHLFPEEGPGAGATGR